MLLVVADTSPLRYLIEIGQVNILPRLFNKVLVPEPVLRELRSSSAPGVVQQWIAAPPAWLEIKPEASTNDPGLLALGDGERAALALGIAIHANLILIDERKGAAAAVQRGLVVTGTLGLLARAAQLGLLDLQDVIARLKGTTFRYSEDLLDAILDKRKGVDRP